MAGLVRLDEPPQHQRRLAPTEASTMRNLLTIAAIFGIGVATGLTYALLALT